MKHKIFLFAMLFLAFSNINYVSYAGDLANDTVWTKRTDELQGFSSVQFIKNDEIIVAQSMGYTIFYDSKDGTEIKRILGGYQALFFDNDNKFLRLNDDRKRFEIFNSENYEVIGELESDEIQLQEFSSYVISKDENWLVGVVPNGLRVWDLNTKRILRTKVKELNTSLVGVTIDKLDFVNNSTLMISIRKDYKTNLGSVWTKTRDLIDFGTLDSISTWGDKGSVFKVSPTAKYIAYGTNGVEIYNLETAELVSNIQLTSDALTGIEFSNDDSFIVTSSTTPSNQLAIWDVKTGKQLYEYPRGSVSCLAISNDKKFICNSSGRSIGKWKITDQMLTISENNLNNILYPNPTNGSLEIKYNVYKPDLFQYEITNINGQIISRNNLGFKSFGENTDYIEVSNLPNGQYNLRLYSTQENINFKFIKE